MNTTTPDRVIVEIKLVTPDGQSIGTGRTERRGNIWRWFHPWGESGTAQSLAGAISDLNAATTTKRQTIPERVMFEENPNAGIVQPFPRGRW